MMLQLLQIEWLKFRKHKAFLVFVLGYLILLPGAVLLFHSFLPNESISDGAPDFFSVQGFYEFPNVWKWVGYFGNWLVSFVVAFMGILLITTEYSYRTLRQSIINGMSRRQFLASKIGVLILVAMAATLYYMLVSLLIGWANSDGAHSWYAIFGSDGASYVWRFFLMTLGYGVMGFFFGMLFKKTGISIILYLAYVMVIELCIRYMIHNEIFQHRSMVFYPANVISYLMPLPQATDMLKPMSAQYKFNLVPAYWEAALATVAYIGLMIFACWRMIMKRDL